MDIREPITVEDSTLAESALSVDFSALRRAAMGLTRVEPLPAALSSLPEPPEEPEEPQAATEASAVATAIERPIRRTVVLFIRPHPYAIAVPAKTLAQRTDTPYEKRTSPATGMVAGLAQC